MLALSFLMLIGVVLVSEASGTPISKGYVYFAMAFSLSVEFLNLRMRMKPLRPSKGGRAVHFYPPSEVVQLLSRCFSRVSGVPLEPVEPQHVLR